MSPNVHFFLFDKKKELPATENINKLPLPKIENIDLQINTLNPKKDLPAKTGEKKVYLPGDIDGNGVLDLADLHLVEELLSGRKPDVPVFTEADVNGDGVIGIEEHSYLLSIIERTKKK